MVGRGPNEPDEVVERTQLHCQLTHLRLLDVIQEVAQRLQIDILEKSRKRGNYSPLERSETLRRRFSQLIFSSEASD